MKYVLSFALAASLLTASVAAIAAPQTNLHVRDVAQRHDVSETQLYQQVYYHHHHHYYHHRHHHHYYHHHRP